MINNKTNKKAIALFFLTITVAQLLIPTFAYPLTSGPTQPEVQSFEPVGTADMVDLFTGDFVYNIPLMDVDGYPVNISYHGGVTMDQEASWVGLGWNINPGVVNRAVRGLPDDFDGEIIQKDLNVKDEITKKFGLGVGAELAGIGQPILNLSAGLGATLNMSNYRGTSVDLVSTFTAQVNMGLSVGFNLGASAGSQSGGAIDYGMCVGIGASQSISKDASFGGCFNLNYGGTYSPRTGLRREAGYNIGLSYSSQQAGKGSFSTGASVPIGLQNYTPAISNVATINSVAGRLKIGGEIFGIYANANVNASVSTINYESVGSMPGYGYFNYEHATDKSIKDFSREKDGMFNTTMHFLPQSTNTYDVYSVAGQGTGGSFRPYRNDYGNVNDPYVASPESEVESYMLEAGLGNGFEFGVDGSVTHSKTQAGPWDDYKRGFASDETGTLYEKIYFKEAGELTAGDAAQMSQTNGFGVMTPEEAKNLPFKKGSSVSSRVARANLITVKKASESEVAGTGSQTDLESYTSTNGFADYATTKAISKFTIPRKDASNIGRKAHHTSEVVQLQKDGRKYVYGLPVVNNIQKEATFSVDHESGNPPLTKYNPGQQDTKNNDKGLEHYYSATVTPTHTTAFLLTSVQSVDYVDLTGNGPSDDDLGSYTKFNYTRKSTDYRWRSPIEDSFASYSEGYYSDKRDEKASYLLGSREQWILHSIETKNSIAEFYVSERDDAKGVKDKILDGLGHYNENPYNTKLSTAVSSWKLDNIKLYNKQDRLINGTNAVPIKTVSFEYDYTLCPGVPNFVGSGTPGKLTLTKIYTKYGNSGKGLISPYQFVYSSVNPGYSAIEKDRWGTYKTNNTSHNNHEFPYTTQSSTTDATASAWSLDTIKLPSGGFIKVNYESDDYGYVQDKEAMEMVQVIGIGGNKDLVTDNELYFDKKSPNNYLYFQRKTSMEIPSVSFRDQYLKGTKLLAFNFAVKLTDNVYEPIKGYAEVDSVGICSNNSGYGWVRLKPSDLDGGQGKINPICKTALNVGRYNLPHVFFPGADPESSDIQNVVMGMKNSIKELVKIHKNPLLQFLKDERGKEVQLSRSYMRLTSVGLKKKGGGQRVKSIYFHDNWNAMVNSVASNAPNAFYGKEYSYTIASDNGKGVISSGVASYEPMIGGDENPFRMPVSYIAQAGVTFPPNDPVDLYQELPIGESFFPSPVVGYRNVTVKSVHFENGRSSHYKDEYAFYTAKQFPVETDFSPIKMPDAEKKMSLKGVEIKQKATQGFVIILNDMHGKPLSTKKTVVLPKGGEETVSYQQFIYKMSGGSLNNDNDIIASNSNHELIHQTKTYGIETDISLDTRMRKEESNTFQITGNINQFFFGIVPIIIPLGYPWSMSNKSEFKCATTTKVIQRYGILDEVKYNNNGTITNVKNETYDQFTGEPVITSVNNEYNDREYTMNYPAYWGNKGMGPAFQNIGYVKTFDTMRAMAPYFNQNLPMGQLFGLIYTSEQELRRFRIGDEVILTFNKIKMPNGSITQGNNLIVGRIVDYYDPFSKEDLPMACGIIFQPNHPKDISFWDCSMPFSATPVKGFEAIINPTLKIINSGFTNQLTEFTQNVRTTNKSNFFPTVVESFTDLISLKATEFSRQQNFYQQAAATDDSSYNVYLCGKMSKVYKPHKFHEIKEARNYGGTTARNSGLFNSNGLFTTYKAVDDTNWTSKPYCNKASNLNSIFYTGASRYDHFGGPILRSAGAITGPVTAAAVSSIVTKTISVLDEHGKELENVDAINNRGAVIYGYNNELPVAVGQNTAHNQFFAENFEDLDLLIPKTYSSNYYFFNPYSPIQNSFKATTSYGDYLLRSSTNSNLTLATTESHSGNRSLAVGNSTQSFTLPYQYASWQTFQFPKTGQGFQLQANTSYVASVWVKKQGLTSSTITLDYGTISSLGINIGGTLTQFKPKGGIIEGWQQYEATFTSPIYGTSTTLELKLAHGYYYDDLRMYPTKANMKSFVYNPFNSKLMATLDENNYATFFEYDAEGRLVRTKKETEKGNLTISESRSASRKTN